MADTGKKTGAGHPIHTNTTTPSKPHSSDSTSGEEHTDFQSRDSKGDVSVTKDNAHKTDSSSLDWAHQAHDKK